MGDRVQPGARRGGIAQIREQVGFDSHRVKLAHAQAWRQKRFPVRAGLHAEFHFPGFLKLVVNRDIDPVNARRLAVFLFKYAKIGLFLMRVVNFQHQRIKIFPGV